MITTQPYTINEPQPKRMPASAVVTMARLMPLSIHDLQTGLELQLLATPDATPSLHFDIEEQSLPRQEGGRGGEDEDISWEERIELPLDEMNLDRDRATDEEEGYSPEPAEDFLSYAWSRLEEEFDPELEEEAEAMGQLSSIINRWKPGHYPVPGAIDPGMRLWLDDLRHEFPIPISFGAEALPVPSIIYHVQKGVLSYEVNLGILEQLRSTGSKEQDKEILFHLNNIEVRYDLLVLLRDWLRYSLHLVAQFLIREQSKAILAGTHAETIALRRPLTQSKLVKYSTFVGWKRDAAWASRTIRNKWVQLPNSQEVLPLIFYFEKTKQEDPLDVLLAMIDLHVIRDGNPPLSAPDQLVILKTLVGKDVQPQSVRKTLWPKLRKLYDKEQWVALGITGKSGRKSETHRDLELLRLIERLAEELGREVVVPTEAEMTQLRAKIKKEEKKSNKGAKTRQENGEITVQLPE